MCFVLNFEENQINLFCVYYVLLISSHHQKINIIEENHMEKIINHFWESPSNNKY